MTPSRLRDCLALLRWSQRALADALTMDERQVRRWASGDAVVPQPVEEWLERRAVAMEADPPPVRQRAA